jgi:hypothetical protein
MFYNSHFQSERKLEKTGHTIYSAGYYLKGEEGYQRFHWERSELRRVQNHVVWQFLFFNPFGARICLLVYTDARVTAVLPYMWLWAGLQGQRLFLFGNKRTVTTNRIENISAFIIIDSAVITGDAVLCKEKFNKRIKNRRMGIEGGKNNNDLNIAAIFFLFLFNNQYDGEYVELGFGWHDII